MKTFLSFLLMLWLCTCAAHAHARPKIGLVLGGGGAAGVSHVGVLKVLEANHIPVDVVAGNSMGAIVGSLYASGMPVAEIERVANQLDWAKLFSDDPDHALKSYQQKQQSADFFSSASVGVAKDGVKLPSGFVDGQRLMFELRRLLAPVEGISDFDRLPIPFRAVATDIRTGETVVLKQGSLATAVRASMSIPGLFAPVTIDNRLLVDGLVSNNLPVDVARQMGSDIVIVSSIPPSTNRPLNSALDISLQSMELLMRKSSEAQLASLTPRDILIYPQIGDIGSLDFARVKETIPLGEKGAKLQQAALQRLARELGTSIRPVAKAITPAQGMMRIARVELENGSSLSDNLILRKLGIRSGEVLDEHKLQAGLDRIYSLGYFELVDYHLTPLTGNDYALKVMAHQSVEGDQRVKFGFSLSDDFNGDTQYQAGVKYVRKGLTKQGTELRAQGIIGERLLAQAELHHPMQGQEANFVEPRVWYQERDAGVWQDNTQVAELRTREAGAQVDVGRELGTSGEVRAGMFYQHIRPKLKSGVIPAELADQTVTESGLKLQYAADTLDSVNFPTQGGRFKAAISRGFALLGSDNDFTRLEVEGERVVSLTDKHRVIVSGRAVANDEDQSQIEYTANTVQNGRVAFLDNQQRVGNYVADGAVTYMRQMASIPQVAKVHVGASVGLGQAWQRASEMNVGDLRYSTAVFVGAETPLGPAYAGVRKTEGEDNTLYFNFGRDF